MGRAHTLFLLVTAFFEGGAVMAAELLGAKLIAPYYGSSLYVWAGILGVTLTGLAGGYFTGSYLSKKNNSQHLLFMLMMAGAIALGLMPLVTVSVGEATMGMELKTGIIISCLSLLLIPLTCFGTVSPLMIKSLTDSRSDGGKVTGTVYAVSTIGGILFTILTGFYFIPQWGLTSFAYIIAGLIALFPLSYLIMLALSRQNGAK